MFFLRMYFPFHWACRHYHHALTLVLSLMAAFMFRTSAFIVSGSTGTWIALIFRYSPACEETQHMPFSHTTLFNDPSDLTTPRRGVLLPSCTCQTWELVHSLLYFRVLDGRSIKSTSSFINTMLVKNS
uniref:Putative secreted protein n=1 Tax=Amblyomma cajennense TaxID=34607 RepID=A0A023FBY4_AMBCJ